MNARGQYGNGGNRTRVSGPGPGTPDPRYVAMRRAMRAIFPLYNHTRAPYYVYAEVNGAAEATPVYTVDDVNMRVRALEHAIGEVYVAVFAVTDSNWPDPAYQTYRTSPTSQVGAVVDASALYLHTVGDREEATKRLARSMTSTYVDLATQVGVIPDAGSAERVKKNPIWYNWWKGTAAPFFKDWNTFHAEQLREGDNSWLAQYIAYGARFTEAWSTYQDWKQRLQGIRAGALSVGLKLTTPEPEDLPTSLPEDVIHAVKRVGEKAGEKAGEAWDILKYGLIAVLGIGGVIALASVASNLRSGKDPAEKYMELARSRRHPRQLALSEGT